MAFTSKFLLMTFWKLDFNKVIFPRPSQRELTPTVDQVKCDIRQKQKKKDSLDEAAFYFFRF